MTCLIYNLQHIPKKTRYLGKIEYLNFVCV